MVLAPAAVVVGVVRLVAALLLLLAPVPVVRVARVVPAHVRFGAAVGEHATSRGTAQRSHEFAAVIDACRGWGALGPAAQQGERGLGGGRAARPLAPQSGEALLTYWCLRSSEPKPMAANGAEYGEGSLDGSEGMDCSVGRCGRGRRGRHIR